MFNNNNSIIVIFLLLRVVSSLNYTLYIGSYNASINIFTLNNNNLYYENTVETNNNPSWLSISNNKKYLYAVNEIEDYDGKYSGSVSSYSIDNYINLEYINEISSQGASPCHSLISNKYIYVSNYCGGTTSVISINETNGALLEIVQHIDYNKVPATDCNSNSHIHETIIDGQHCFVMDLGNDCIYQNSLNEETGEINPPIDANIVPPAVALPVGSGPRHMVVHPSLDFAFVISELDCSLTSLRYNRDVLMWSLQLLDTISTLRITEKCEDMAAAEIQISNNNNIIYVSNRDLTEDPNLNRNSIGVYSYDSSSGKLLLIQHVNTLGIHPRHFTMTNNYLLVANMKSNNIVIFPIDNNTGLLYPDGKVYESEHILSPTQILLVAN